MLFVKEKDCRATPADMVVVDHGSLAADASANDGRYLAAIAWCK